MSTGGIIWEVEGRGSSSKGVAYHTDSPTQVFDLGWWVCMICYPLTTTPPTFHLPNNSTWVGESVWYATPLLLLPRPSTSQIIPPVVMRGCRIKGVLMVFSKCFRAGYFTFSQLKFKVNKGINTWNLCFKIKTKTYLVFISVVTIHCACHCQLIGI